jgi:hypothetical protein
MTVLIYVNTSKSEIPSTSRSSPLREAAETWFMLNDPEGVAIKYEVMGLPIGTSTR